MAYEWPTAERTIFEEGLAELDPDIQREVVRLLPHPLPACDPYCSYVVLRALEQGQAIQEHMLRRLATEERRVTRLQALEEMRVRSAGGSH